jgi:hypothetical protein
MILKARRLAARVSSLASPISFSATGRTALAFTLVVLMLSYCKRLLVKLAMVALRQLVKRLNCNLDILCLIFNLF